MWKPKIGKFTKATFFVAFLVFIAFIPVIGLPLAIFILCYYMYKNYLKVFRGYRDVKEEYKLIMKEDEDLK